MWGERERERELETERQREREQACTCGHEHVYTLEFIALRISSDGKALTGEVLLPFKKLEFAHIS